MYDPYKTAYVVETARVVLEHGYKSSQLNKSNATTENIQIYFATMYSQNTTMKGVRIYTERARFTWERCGARTVPLFRLY